MEDNKPYIYGLGPVPEGAKPNGQGGWYYPETGRMLDEPLSFKTEIKPRSFQTVAAINKMVEDLRLIMFPDEDNNT